MQKKFIHLGTSNIFTHVITADHYFTGANIIVTIISCFHSITS